MNLTLNVLPEKLAVCKADIHAKEFITSPWWSVTRTADELSIVLPTANARPEWTISSGWRALQVQGPLDFSLVGIMANLSHILAQAAVSIFAISTYDTDYILVKEDKLATAVAALRQAGHTVVE